MMVFLYLFVLAMGLGLTALAGFLWAVKNDQFEDLEGEAHRILRDDE